jgi:DNA-binding transcriptional LysR family regulator
MHHIHIMNYEDLNFLYLIDALYQERSVSRAAERLDLTQPAVSHGLSRMRVKFGDELFVRSGSGMSPTPTGERIALGAHRALELIQSDIWDGPSFSPAKSDRTFVVGMTDMGGTVILPQVISVTSTEAPSIHIKPVAVRPAEVSELLESGLIDLAWGYFGHLSEKLYQQTLFRRSLTGIIRKGKRKTKRMDFETFVSTPHVIASATSQTNELLQQKIREQGQTLRIALEVPYLLAIPRIIAGSDYIATVPDELADLFLRLADIEVFKLPLPIPDIAVKQYWHARYNGDAGHQWFRKMVQNCFGDAAGKKIK